jgi:hypothetical protein
LQDRGDTCCRTWSYRAQAGPEKPESGKTTAAFLAGACNVN